MECRFLLCRLCRTVNEIECEALRFRLLLRCAAEEVNQIFRFLRWLWQGLRLTLRLTIFLLTGLWLGYLVTIVIA